MRKQLFSTASALLLTAAPCCTALAVDLTDKIELHGYGNAGYLQTSANQYLKADRSGTWDYYAAALLFTGTLNDKTKLWAQAFTSSGGPKRSHLDWMFVDYRHNSNFILRAGQIKLPMGLYNEVRDIEFVQLSTLKPMFYQEATEIADEAFRGVSVVFDHDLGNGSLSWDAYTGKTIDFQSSDIRYSGLRGGRVTYNTPVDGLRLMLSGHWEDVENVDTTAKSSEKTVLISAEYVNNHVDLKTEYVKKATFGISTKSGYLQAGYTLAEKWTPYIRSDFITTDYSQSDDPAYYQRTQTVGLGYKVNRNIGLRIEAHFNHGYALPVASLEAAAGAGVTDWRMLGTSVNFMF